MSISEKNWDALRQGIHICAIYRNPAEQFVPMLSYFWSGFDKSERCMYFYDENPPEKFSEALHIYTEPETEPMEVFHYADVYARTGNFDPDTMIGLLEDTLQESAENGFSGIRAAGEMSWIMKTKTPHEKYFEYERKLNSFYPTRKLIGVCQFDENKFSEDFLAEMIRTHPYILLYGKLYQNRLFYVPPNTVSTNDSPSESYDAMVLAISEEEPIIA